MIQKLRLLYNLSRDTLFFSGFKDGLRCSLTVNLFDWVTIRKIMAYHFYIDSYILKKRGPYFLLIGTCKIWPFIKSYVYYIMAGKGPWFSSYQSRFEMFFEPVNLFDWVTLRKIMAYHFYIDSYILKKRGPYFFLIGWNM